MVIEMTRCIFVTIRQPEAELGCPHFAGIFALGAAIEMMNEVGKQQIEQRALELSRILTSRLTGGRLAGPVAHR